VSGGQLQGTGRYTKEAKDERARLRILMKARREILARH